jgi:hypothetical protein
VGLPLRPKRRDTAREGALDLRVPLYKYCTTNNNKKTFARDDYKTIFKSLSRRRNNPNPKLFALLLPHGDTLEI